MNFTSNRIEMTLVVHSNDRKAILDNTTLKNYQVQNFEDPPIESSFNYRWVIAFFPDDDQLNKLLQNPAIDSLTCFLETENPESYFSFFDRGLRDFAAVKKNQWLEINYYLGKWKKKIQFYKDEKQELWSALKFEKKRAEQLNELFDDLIDRTIHHKANLNEVIDELESFSYSVSHDLRAPLRAIAGFTDIIKEEYDSQIDEQGKKYLGYIQQGTQKMSHLIDELLNFSRISRVELRKLVFDPQSMISDIVAESKMEFRSDTEVIFGEIRPLYGDAGTIKQVFTNLIRNAFKFSQGAEKPVIKIKSFVKDNCTHFNFYDNGVGFDMRYADKLFKVFQRLHTEEEFDGAGVGLAIVYRIIRKHGGKVTGESHDGQTKFCFSLPLKTEEHA